MKDGVPLFGPRGTYSQYNFENSPSNRKCKMNDAAIVAAWAAAIAAVVGPIVSVRMAHQMVKHHDKRTAAAELFYHLVEHASNFRNEMLDAYHLNQKVREKLEVIMDTSIDSALSEEAVLDQGKHPDLDQTFDDLKRLGYSSLDRNLSQCESAFRQARILRSQLDADGMALELLLGQQSRKCADSIKHYGDYIHELDEIQERSKMIFEEIVCENFEGILNERYEQIVTELASLHRSMEAMDEAGCPL